MKSISNLFRNKIELFIWGILLINLIGGYYVYSKSSNQHIFIPTGDPLEAEIALSSPQINVSKDIQQTNQTYFVDLIVKVKNNTKDQLTNVRFILPSRKDFGAIESPTTLRYTHSSPKDTESIFLLPNIFPGKQESGHIYLYVTNSGIYPIKASIETNEEMTVVTNVLTLTAD